MSALEGLPSFSKAAFSQTNPQFVYKEVRRIGDAKAPSENSTGRPTLVKQRPLPEVKSLLLINGVDPKCKNVIKFKSTDYPLPFLYGDSIASPLDSQKPQSQSQKPSPATTTTGKGSSSRKEEPHERKRPKRDSERRVSVEVAVQPERKRPKREAERRAEAAARKGK